MARNCTGVSVCGLLHLRWTEKPNKELRCVAERRMGDSWMQPQDALDIFR